MRKWIIVILAAVLLLGGCTKKEEPTPVATTAAGDSNPVVTMTVADFGVIMIELYPDKAPNTVHSFISLINKGYYDGLKFHRVAPGFVIQGGDPLGTGQGGPGYKIAGEFPANGFSQNDLLHTRGTLSMARSDSYDSAGSQFFICLDDTPHLDSLGYAAFGRVVGEDSFKTLDKIAKVKLKSKETPETPPVMEKVTVDTFGVEYPEPIIIE